MAGPAGAHLLVGRVRRVAAGVADRRRVDAGRLPEHPLGAPEAAHADDRGLEAVGERRAERRAEHLVALRHLHLGVPAGERRAGLRNAQSEVGEETHGQSLVTERGLAPLYGIRGDQSADMTPAAMSSRAARPMKIEVASVVERVRPSFEPSFW